MPINKNIFFRLNIYDELLANGKKCDRATLMTKVNQALKSQLDKSPISERTFFNDMNQLKAHPPEGYAAPLECDEQGRYHYTVQGFSIRLMNFSQKQLEAMRESLEIIRQFDGLPYFEILNQVFRVDAGKQDKPLRQIVQFEAHSLSKGLDKIKPIVEAIQTEKALTISYKPFYEQSENTYLVHPYLLKEYRNRWFLLAKNDKAQEIWTFALDRIGSLRTSIKEYVHAPDFHPDQYFTDFIGISVPKLFKCEKITIQVHTNQAPYLESKPIHHSQRLIEHSHDGSIFEFTLIPNFEFMSELYRLGPNLFRVTPADLFERITAAYVRL
jgi:predicted DNA-binding transcriptional regulator YafY